MLQDENEKRDMHLPASGENNINGGEKSPQKRISPKESTSSNILTSLYWRRKRGRRTGAKAGGGRLSNYGYGPVLEVLGSNQLDFWWMRLVSLPDKGFAIRIYHIRTRWAPMATSLNIILPSQRVANVQESIAHLRKKELQPGG